MTTAVEASHYPVARVLRRRPPSLAEQIVAVIHALKDQLADDWTAVSDQQLVYVLGGLDALISVLDAIARSYEGRQ